MSSAAPTSLPGDAIQSTTAAPPEFDPQPFVPRRFLTNGHLQTIAGNFLLRSNHLPPPTPELWTTTKAL